MNLCVCAMGDSVPRSAQSARGAVPFGGAHVFHYPSNTAPAVVARDALTRNYSHALVLSASAVLDPAFAAKWPAVARAVERLTVAECVYLGAEHYGPLVGIGLSGADFSLRLATVSTGGQAYILRHGGLLRVAAGAGLSGLCRYAVLPSLVHSREMPRHLVARLAEGVLPRGERGHCALQRRLESEWQGLLLALVAFVIFDRLSGAVTRTVRHACT